MKVYRTAAITAAWRYMAKVDDCSIKQVRFPLKFLACILGFLDRNSVETIKERTRIIDSIIRKSKPKCIVEIGAGFSSRAQRFDGIKCYELDLPYFQKAKSSIIPFNIGKDELELEIKGALFIVEGVTMYLQEEQVITLLKQIKKYKGHILIDFFDNEHSSIKKNLREKIFKFLFRRIIQREHLFDFRIRNMQDGIALLECIGYANVKHYPYNIAKTLDNLFYAKL